MKNHLNRIEEGSTFRSDAVPSTSRTSDNSDSVAEVVRNNYKFKTEGYLGFVHNYFTFYRRKNMLQ